MSADRKQEILQRLNFEDFYRGELGDLKPARGDEVLALCPFHDDSNPSLSVNVKTGLFNCFGCDAKGDVFAFYQRRHGADFKTALDDIGRLAGVEKKTPKSTSPDFQSLGLTEFARAKELPETFLKSQGINQYGFPDGTACVDFPYKDAAGQVVAIRHRFANKGDKKFRWRKGDKVYPYGLWRWPEIRQAGWALLVEGETDSLTCWLAGLPALGLPGKKTWARCWQILKDLPGVQEVQFYLWQEPDAVDLPGEVGRDLPGMLVISAPEQFKDLSEAYCQGNDLPVLVHGLRETAKPPPPAAITGGFTYDDLGNARRLVALHGQDIRYCHLSKKWYHWTGSFWEVDYCGEVERRAKLVIGSLYREAADSGDTKEASRIAKFAMTSSSVNRILATVRLAQSEPGIQVKPSSMNADPWLFNCRNGTIDLRTGELQPARREDLITSMAPVDYNPDAPCELWEKFLYQIMDFEQRPDTCHRMVNFLQQALGYSLTGDCREECLFILWGSGANGKSTLVNTISELLGDYSRNTPVESLLSRPKGGEIPTDIARLDGPRFVTTSEVDRGRRLAESLVKALTGRDTITARYLYGEFFDFEPQFKLWLSTNNKPIIKGADDAIWRRIMFLRFPVHIPKEERDGELKVKLLSEGPGILSWLVRGCLYWQQFGFDVPPEVTTDIAEYRNEMDVLAEFIEDRCIVQPNNWATASDLYEAYTSWAEDAGLKDKEVLKQRTFGSCLSERGFMRDKGAKGQRLWRGVGLHEQDFYVPPSAP
jgi:putative DNA primase/helicase